MFRLIRRVTKNGQFPDESTKIKGEQIHSVGVRKY
jgi:hypothetical protein